MEETLPKHVAIIMDGNGRWAKKRLMPRSLGHKAGMDRMISLSEYIFDRGIPYCTLYALSTENFKRPEEELEGLFRLFREYFKKNTDKLKKKQIALRVLGNKSLLPEDIQALIASGEEETKNGERGTLSLAMGYGSRQEILFAVNRAVKAGKEVDEKEFASLLYTADIPDPDLIIRTGGELRLSNFLLWQAAYAEFYFTDKLFPDFSEKDFDKAIDDYMTRDRRYGKVKDKEKE